MKLGSGVRAQALVDDRDFSRVSDHKWTLEKRPNGDCYARACINGKWVRMHRFIMRMGPGQPRLDHRDHDGLNNRRKNLRVASAWQNGANKIKRLRFSSKFKGVHRNRVSGGWEAVIRKGGVPRYLGIFRREDLAAAAYDGAARILFGRWASLNLR